MSFNYINYATLGMMNKNQVGSNQTGSDEEFNYKNGLNRKELSVIDVNKDGAITEEEFKTAFGGTKEDAYKQYWQKYAEYYSANTDTNGVTTQKKNGVKTESSFDGERMTSYTQTKLNKDGSVEIKTFEYNKDTQEYDMLSTITTFCDGSQITKYSDGIEEYLWVDGKHEKYDKNGLLIYASAKDEKTGETYTYSFEYSEKMFPKSVTFGGKTYTDICLKNEEGEVFQTQNKDQDISDFNIIVFQETDTETMVSTDVLTFTTNGKGVFTVVDLTGDKDVANTFGTYKKAEATEEIVRDENNPNKTTIKTTLHGLLLKEENIEMKDGLAVVNELREYTYSIKEEKNEETVKPELFVSQEIIKDRVTGETTKALYKEGLETPYFKSVKDKKGKTVSAEGTLEGILKEKYPNLSTVQIEQLAKECAKINEIDIGETVKFDPVTNDFALTIPKYRIDTETDNITIVQGTLEDYIKENYKDLTASQQTQLMNECIRTHIKIGRFSLVTFDPEENKYNITMPTFVIKEDEELEFIYEEEEE